MRVVPSVDFPGTSSARIEPQNGLDKDEESVVDGWPHPRGGLMINIECDHTIKGKDD